MTTTTLNPTSASGLRGLWARFRDMLERDAIYRSTVRDLHQLSDRSLEDIGIYRGDIHRIAEDCARRH
jgi:uncharacterized protein YjiS (DUF1127 family)